MRRLIKTDSTHVDIEQPKTIAQIQELLDADCLCTVILKHLGEPVHVMFVDDNGHERDKPVNERATELYHLNCRPGTTHQIVGDVFVLPDGDFA